MSALEPALLHALRFLRRKARSRAEVRAHLRAKSHDEESIDEALKWLGAKGILGDEKLAHDELERARTVAPIGAIGLEARLRRRGIEAELAEILASGMTEEEQVAQARRLLSKKRYDSWIKAAQFLTRKGYSEDVVREALQDIEFEEGVPSE